MIKRSLDTNALTKKLQSMKNRSLKKVSLPKGVTKRKFDLFMRVMEARDTEEIKDLSMEDLASLFVDAEDCISVIYEDSILGNPERMLSSFQKMKAKPLRRRIL